MKKFELEAPIVMKNKAEIANYLRNIANAIDNGQEYGLLNHEGCQGCAWSVDNDDFDEFMR